MDQDKAVAVAFLIQTQQIIPVTLLGVALAPEFIFKRKKVTRAEDEGLHLESRATQNVTEAANREEAMSRSLGSVLNAIKSAESRSAQARMVGNEEQMSARLGQLAQRLNQRQAASEEIMAMRAQRSLDARSQ